MTESGRREEKSHNHKYIHKQTHKQRLKDISQDYHLAHYDIDKIQMKIHKKNLQS